jgi:DNA-directed RNA polymerase specialized sigma24 family protein
MYLSALPFEPAAPEREADDGHPLPGALDLREAIRSLPAKLRDVVEHRYGFANGQEESLAVIGSRLGLSRQAVQLREKKALAELRRRFTAQQSASSPATSEPTPS